MKSTRTRHSVAFKAKVALAAIREQETIPALARRHGVHANQIYKWKKEFMDRAASVFEQPGEPAGGTEREKELLEKIGGLTVWATDITYIPMAHGFAYLVAIIHWYSRRALAWRLSNTLESTFCVEALQEALASFPKPTIFNTDQGSQFTAEAFTSVLRGAGVTISMDGRGRCIDNVFVERVWRSLKYEEVFLHAYEDLDEARAGIGRYFEFYNLVRPHQALGYQTPDVFYRGVTLTAA